jgi:hypothetical protein
MQRKDIKIVSIDLCLYITTWLWLIFLKIYKITSVLSLHAPVVLKFFVALLKKN